jgi:hypothetical protein
LVLHRSFLLGVSAYAQQTIAAECYKNSNNTHS